MGSGQSVRATHFNRTDEAALAPEPAAEPEEADEEHHISISNKMVSFLTYVTVSSDEILD